MDENKLAKELKSDEGFMPHAYQDHLSYWTIGYGRLIDKRKGGGITEDEAAYLLHNDIARKWAELKKALPWVIDQPESVQRALTNMCFQMGVEGVLKFKNSLALIRAGDYTNARKNLEQSLWFRQTPNRAKRVIAMVRKD